MSWLTHLLSTLFSWPNGIVDGNLIASGICVVLAAFHLDRLARKHHREHMRQLRRNESGTDDERRI